MELWSKSNTKTLKGESKGYMTFILHLAPSDVSGHDVCPKASPGCIAGCLGTTAGRVTFTPSILPARIRKTNEFFADRQAFMRRLHRDTLRAIAYAERKGFIPVFRPNGTSDLAWERYSYDYEGVHYQNIMTAFPTVQWYDYTKRLGRKTPANYHLTFSRSEINELDCRLALKAGLNVATVFVKGNIPAEYLGHSVINGDESDLRFLDPQGVIVGLYAKGGAKKDCSGFVVR